MKNGRKWIDIEKGGRETEHGKSNAKKVESVTKVKGMKKKGRQK